MRKILTPCNLAIVIALGCFSYIVVQSFYERQATAELYRTVLELNAQAMNTAANATAILSGIKPSETVEVEEPKADEVRPEKIAAFKPKRTARKRKANPCEEVIRTETFGNYEVRYKDLKCLNAQRFEEQ